MQGDRFAGLALYNEDSNGGGRPIKYPFSVYSSSISNYYYGITVAQYIEGASYVSKFATVGTNANNIIFYDRRSNHTANSGSKNGNYSYNAGAGQNIINNTTTFTFTVNGEDYSSSYGGIIFDLDNNKSYFSLGTTGSASDWVAVIARAPSGSIISTLNMDNSGVAPVNNWYTTNPAQRSGKNFSEGVTAVAIMPTGSILSASVEDLNYIEVLASENGAGLFIGPSGAETYVTYSAENQTFNGYNIYYLTDFDLLTTPEPLLKIYRLQIKANDTVIIKHSN